MDLESGLYLVLEYDGAVSLYDGIDHLGLWESTPKDLQVKNGSFQRFAEALATIHGLKIKPVIEWLHVFELV